MEGGDVMSEEKKRGKGNANSGRKFDQKMKPFFVYQYLMRETDEKHCVKASDIIEFLDLNFKISAERRSIYHDIQEINKAILAFEEDITLEEAEERIFDDEEEKVIRYKPNKGFYVAKRKYEEEDIRLIAECVQAAKFVDEKRADMLLSDVIYKWVSEHQAESMRYTVFVKDRVKTINKKVYYNIITINEAINRPRRSRIKFHYTKHDFDQTNQLCNRRNGFEYTVIPYALIIDNGNYYLLGIDEDKKQPRTYRVDRMNDVSSVEDYLGSFEEYEDVDIKQYTQGHFGMFEGEKCRITMRFTMRMLDAVIDRFGIHDAVYQKSGKGFFTMTATVYVSNQFFGWVCGFGKQAKILYPYSVKQKFEKYITEIYEANK